MASTSAATAAVGRQTGAASGSGSLRWRDHGRNRWPAGKRIGGWHHDPKALLCCNQFIQNNVNTISLSAPCLPASAVPFPSGSLPFRYEH